MGLCTVADILLENKGINQNAAAASVIEENDYFSTEAIGWVTERIESVCNQPFAPIRLPNWYDAPPFIPLDPSLWCVLLNFPLVAVASFAYEDTALLAWAPPTPFAQRAASDYYLSPIGGQLPYLQAYLNPKWLTGSPDTFYGGNSQQVILVDGLWCYRRNYARVGWPSSGQTVQNNPLSSSGTALTVTSNAVFSPGQWIRFRDASAAVDDEIALVTAVSPSPTTSVTIARGERNTVATSHAQNCPIDLWSTEPDIQRAATRWCAYLYQRRAVFETLRVTQGASGSISQLFPQDAPEEVVNILGKYMNGWTLGTSGWTGTR